MDDLARWKVRGPVKTIRTTRAQWDLVLDHWQNSGTEGFAAFRRDGKLDENGQPGRDGSVAIHKCLYDESGRLIERQSRVNDSVSYRRVYSYDENGREIRVGVIDAEGSEREIETSSYGTDGCKTTVRVVDSGRPGTPVYFGVEGSDQFIGAENAVTMSIAHDANEMPVEVVFHDASGSVLRRGLFVRDEAGRLLSEEIRFGASLPLDAAVAAKVFGPTFALSSSTFNYDSEGRVVERIRSMGSLNQERTTFLYDDRGNPIEETSEHYGREINADDSGELRTTKESRRMQHSRFEYIYDDHGNWTERVVFSRFDPDSDFQRSNVEWRQITYYA